VDLRREHGGSDLRVAAAVTALGSFGGWLLASGLRNSTTLTLGLPAGASVLVGVGMLAAAAAVVVRSGAGQGRPLRRLPVWGVAALVALPAAVLAAVHLLLG
jgi:hypothetical protein